VTHQSNKKSASEDTYASTTSLLGPYLDALFFTFSITSIFGSTYEVVNIGKKITNYTV
jgi:hypothetical protein